MQKTKAQRSLNVGSAVSGIAKKLHLSVSLGLIFSFSPRAALANPAPPPPPPTPPVVTHSATNVVTNTPNIQLHNSSASTSHTTSNNSTAPHHHANNASVLTNELNLGSTAASVSASQLGTFKTITINVGGKTDVVNLSTKLTDAEAVASQQVLTSGQQTLVLNANGAASGGAVRLNGQSLSSIDAITGGSLASIFVPKNVNLLDGLNNLTLSGSLINYGSIVASQVNQSAETISAKTIFNASGAQITSSGDLTLNASQSLSNVGAISSTGKLTVNAASLTNTGSGASLNSAGDLTIVVPSVQNSGLISSHQNVNFASPQQITLQNTGGTIQSVAGNVNVRDSSYTGNSGVNISGGNIFSNQLNLNAGSGIVNVHADNITGVVNVNAGVAHVLTAAPDLRLGNLNTSGDPTYYNQGNITISGSIAPTNGQALAIVASGSILSDGGTLNTSSSTGSGGDLNLIAGANFTTSNGTTSGSNNATTTLFITGTGSATGGLIDLTGGHGGGAPVTLISTASTGGGGNGGNLTMVAFPGSKTGSGAVLLPQNVTVTTGGNGDGTNGSIHIVSGLASGTAISTGNLDTTGGSGTVINGGTVTLGTGTVSVLDNVQITNGSITAGSFFNPLFGTGTINVGSIYTAGNSVTLNSAGAFNFTNIDASGKGGTSTVGQAGGNGGDGAFVWLTAGSIKGGNIYTMGGGGAGGASGKNGGNGGTGGEVLIDTSGGVSLTGQINASGGGGGGGGGQSVGGGSIGAGGSGGGTTTGAIAFISGGPVTVGGTIYAANGANGGAGSAAFGKIAGGGGGGGGSFGEGGGGGAAGVSTGGTGGAAGGGGGGVFGGGGGGATAGVAVTGGAGGGFEQGGAGGGSGIYAGKAGGSDVGGAGGAASGEGGAGGALGLGGGGGHAGTQATSGGNVINAGNLQGGSLYFGLADGSAGSAVAPIKSFVQSLYVDNTGTGSVFLSNQSAIALQSLTLDSTATAQVSANGSITTATAAITAGTLSLTTQLGSNGGITISAPVTATTVNLQADGSGQIQTQTKGNITSENLNVTSLTGDITLNISPSSSSSNLTVNTNASSTQITTSGNVTLLVSKFSPTGTFTLDSDGTITVQGTLTGGQAFFNSSTGITLNANVLVSQLRLDSTGNITTMSGLVETAPTLVFLVGDKANIGSASAPFATTATEIGIGPFGPVAFGNAYLLDTASGAVSFDNSGIGNNIVFTATKASDLYITGGNTTNGTFSNTSANGNIDVAGSTGSGTGTINVSTVGGAIIQDNGILNGNTVNIISKSGAIGLPLELLVNASNVSTVTGSNASVSILDESTDNLNITKAAGADITFVAGGGIVVSGAISGSTIMLTPTYGLVVNAEIKGTEAIDIVGSLHSTEYDINAPLMAPAVQIPDTGPSLATINLNASIGTGTGPVQIADVGSITAANSTVVVSGSSIILSAVQIATVSGSPLTINTPSLQLNADSANLQDTGNVSLTQFIGTNITFATTGAITQQNYIGGTNVTLSGASFTQPALGEINVTGTFTFNATGSGSAVSLSGLNMANAFTITTPAAANVLIAGGASIAASSVNIQTDSATLNGLLETGSTTVAGKIAASDVSISAAGAISIKSGATISADNALAFNGPSLVNDGTLSVGTGGSLVIQNRAGDLSISGNGVWPTKVLDTLTLESDGALNAGPLFNTAPIQVTNLTISAAGVLTLGTNTVTTANNGTIDIQAKSISYANSATSPLILNPSGTTANSASVSVNLTGTTALNVGTASGNLEVNPGDPNATNVTISNGGNLAVNIAGLAVGIGLTDNSISLNGGTSGNGNLYVTGLDNIGRFTTSFEFSANSSQAFVVGNPTVNGILYGGNFEATNMSITNKGGDVQIGNYYDNLISGTNISIAAKGSITGQNGALMIDATNLSLRTTNGSAGGIGTAGTALSTEATNLSLSTSGLVNISNTGSVTVDPIVGSVQSFNLASTGSVTLNSVATSDGSITVSTGGTKLTLAAGSTLATDNGSITLQNTNTASGAIEIGAGDVLHASSTEAGVGNVTIVIGAVPLASQLAAGVTPANVTIDTTGGGRVYFATTADPSGSILAKTPNNDLNAFGRNVIFNTDALPASAITLDGGVTITADPPPVALVPVTTVTMNVSGITPVSGSAPASGIAPASEFATVIGASQIGGTLTALATARPTVAAPAASISSTGVLSNGALSNGLILPLASSLTTQAASTGVVSSLLAPAISAAVLSALVQEDGATSAAKQFLNYEQTAPTKLAAVFSAGEAELDGPAGSSNPEVSQILTGGVSRSYRAKVSPATAAENTSVTRLAHGAHLIAPEQDTELITAFGSVKLDKHCLALLVLSDDGLSVYDFDESHPRSIVVRVGDRQISLYPGRHVTIAPKQTQRFEHVNPAPFVGYRGLSVLDVGTAKSFTAEFHLPSAMVGLKPLREFASSSDTAKKKVVSHLIKTAALNSLMSRNNEPYQTMTMPSLTACNR